MNEEPKVFWYCCTNDYCLRYRTPVDLFPNEPVECRECGDTMAPMPDMDIK